MSAAIKLRGLGATPHQRAMLVVHELCAAAGGARGLDDEATHRAVGIANTVLAAAESGGFIDADLLASLAARGRRRGLVIELATEVVTHVGGPDKLFALIDLVTTPADWRGFCQ